MGGKQQSFLTDFSYNNFNTNHLLEKIMVKSQIYTNGNKLRIKSEISANHCCRSLTQIIYEGYN